MNRVFGGLLLLGFPDGLGELLKRSVNLPGFVGNGVGERLQIFLGGHLQDTQTYKYHEIYPDNTENGVAGKYKGFIHILTFLIETEI